MLMEQERKLIVEYGKKLVTSALTTGTGGNISICDREKGLMAISPSSIDYYEVKPEDIVIMDLKGNIVEGARKPSVEHVMHTIFYTDRKDVNAVVHTHAVACATMAGLHWNLPAVNYLVALSGGVEVPCAKYATFATRELGQAALEAMGNGYAAFLANHGFIAAAPNLPMAFDIAEECEFCAEIYLRTKAVGEPQIITDEQMNQIYERAKALGK